MLRRALALPPRPEESFFLWGPRQTGKTSLLRDTYPNAVWFDLLRTAKATARVHADQLKGLRELHRDQPRVGKRVVVSLETRSRRTEDGIDVLPATVFARELWSGGLLAL
jgi:hypothetical protein